MRHKHRFKRALHTWLLVHGTCQALRGTAWHVPCTESPAREPARHNRRRRNRDVSFASHALIDDNFRPLFRERRRDQTPRRESIDAYEQRSLRTR
jgi:hypothetical protein